MRNPSPLVVVRSNWERCGPVPDEASDSPPCLDAATFERRLRQAIAEAIRMAQEPEQLVLSLLYEHAMSVQEVGSVLGMTEHEVYVLHAHSVARLCGRVMQP